MTGKMKSIRTQTAMALLMSLMIVPGQAMGQQQNGGMPAQPRFQSAPQPTATGGDNLGDHVAQMNLNMSGFQILSLGDPTDLSHAVNLGTLNDRIATARDNLGNHIATQHLQMSGNEVVNLGDPTTATSAVNLRTLDAAIAGSGDNLGNHVATMHVDLNAHRIVNMADPLMSGDAVNLRTLNNAIAAIEGDNLGDHMATQNLDLGGFRAINLADPVDPSDAVTLRRLTDAIDALPVAPVFTGGTGITIDGAVISFSTTWGDNRYALRTRQIIAGDGLSGGGTLETNRTINVDGTVVRTSGNQTIAGNKTFTGTTSFSGQRVTNVGDPSSGTDAANRRWVEAQIAAIPDAPLYTGGTGITVAGTVISFNTTWGDGRYALRTRQIIAGDGLSGGGALSADRTLSVDNTVVRTSGDQDIEGNKTFLDLTSFSGQRIINVGDPTAGTDAANRRWVEARLAAIPGAVPYTGGTGISVAGTVINFDTGWGDNRYALRSRQIIAGDGLSGGGTLQANRTINVDGTVVRTSGNQTIAGNKTFTGTTSFSGQRITNVGDPTAATDAANRRWVEAQIAAIPGAVAYTGGTGITVAGMVISFNTTWGDGRYALRSRQIIAGTGLTGGGTLQANRTLSVDGTVVRTTGNQSIGGEKTFTDMIVMDGNRITGLSNPSHGTDAVNLDTLNAAIAGITGVMPSPVAPGDGIAIVGNVISVNNTVVRTSGNQTIAGNKTFTGTTSFSGQRVTNVADPTSATDAANRRWVLTQIANIPDAPVYTGGTGINVAGTVISFDTGWGDGRYALRSRTITAGTGLTGGGNLQANRTINFDTSWGDGRYALRSRQIIAGDGLSGGGTLQANRTINVDGTVMRNNARQQITAPSSVTQALLHLQATNNDGVGSTLLSGAFPSSSGNRFFMDFAGSGGAREWAVSTDGILRAGSIPWARLINPVSLTAGDGLSGGGTLQSNRTINVDGTVVRTSGNQTIAGNKTFTGTTSFSGQRITNVGDPTAATDAANRRWVLTQIANIPDAPVYTGGTGINVAGTVISFDTGWGDGRYALRSRTITAGTGLTGGGNLQANRTINFDTSWGDGRYALRSRQIIAGDGLSGGGTLQANRTINVDGTVVRTTGNQTIGGTKTFTSSAGVIANGIRIGGDPGNYNAMDIVYHNGNTISQYVNTAIVDTWRIRRHANGGSFADILSLGMNGQLTLGAQATSSGHAVRADRIITAGTGLTGGGNLQSNRTINFDTSWGDGRYALRSRTITAGTGLTGGGNLQANRTINFDTGWGDGRYALRSRTITAGTGLTGGGNLQSNRTINFDTGWGDSRYANHLPSGAFSNTSTYDAILGATGDGATTFGHSQGGRPSDAPINAQASGLHIGNTWGRAQIVFPNTDNRIFFRTGTRAAWNEVWHTGNLNPSGFTQTSRRIIAGDGLTGGGTLAADRTLSVDSSVVRTSRTITAGTGLTGGGTLQANRTISVDSTVVRTSGNQQIGGTKTFANSGGTQFRRGVTQDGIRLLGRNGGSEGRSVTLTPATLSASRTITLPNASGTVVLDNREIIAGIGLTGGGTLQANRTINLQTISAGSDDRGAVHYNGTSRHSGRFYGGSTNPTNSTRLNYDGNLHVRNMHAIAYFHASDETLKDEIETLDAIDMLERIRQMRPVGYNWIDSGDRSVGLIAQEVQGIFPDLVADRGDGTLSIDYSLMVSPLISVVQHLDQEIEAERARNAELMLVLGTMEERLQALEALLP